MVVVAAAAADHNDDEDDGHDDEDDGHGDGEDDHNNAGGDGAAACGYIMFMCVLCLRLLVDAALGIWSYALCPYGNMLMITYGNFVYTFTYGYIRVAVMLLQLPHEV